MTSTVCKDIFGRELKVGDKVAVGMSLDRSSVLRVGEVVKIKESPRNAYRPDPNSLKWAITVKWTHNGSSERKGYGEVAQSTIKMESHFTYAKLLILPDGFVDAYPPDVDQDV